MRVSTKSNVGAVLKDWKRLGRAYTKTISSGLNKTAYRVKNEDMPKIMERGVDRPTRFTKDNPAFYGKARPKRLRAYIQLQRIQAQYLRPIIEGGRSRKGKPVPIKIRLNKFGNIASLKAGRKVRDLLAQGAFIETIGGIEGVWQRRGKKLNLLIMFSRGGYRYRKQFDWHAGVRKYVYKRMPAAMNEALNKMIKQEAARSVRI